MRSKRRATDLLERDSKFVLDTNLIIAAVKSGWTRSTDLLFTILLSDATLFVDRELHLEYEKYIHKILGLYHLFLFIQTRTYPIDPSAKALDTCRPFFPETQLGDVVHAATCLETDAILITNDSHFDRIKESGLIRVWSITKAIKEVLGD